MLLQRANALAAETAALGVASGWSWYHALECIFPALCAPSPLTRAIGTVAVTAFGVMAMLALKPPPGTAYSEAATDGLQSRGSSAHGGTSISLGGSGHAGVVYASADSGRASPQGDLTYDGPAAAVPARPISLVAHTAGGPPPRPLPLPGSQPLAPPVPSGERDAPATSTEYRAFVDLHRSHSADWLPVTLPSAAAPDEGLPERPHSFTAAARGDVSHRQPFVPQGTLPGNACDGV